MHAECGPELPAADRAEKAAPSKRSVGDAGSPRLIKRAAWCGVVFALVVLITTLNLMPPVGIRYQVRSEILLSESRFTALQETAERDLQDRVDGAQKYVCLTRVSLLDESESSSSSAFQTGERVLLVEVRTEWAGAFSEQHYQSWLAEATRAEVQLPEAESIAKEGRLARWELAATKHYLERESFVGKPQQNVESSRTSFTLASTGANRTPAQLASQTTLASHADDGAFGLELTEPLDLSEQVRAAELRVEKVDQAWQELSAKQAGVLELAHRPELRAKSSTIPMWMAASVLILGLATGAAAGWFQHRLESGGAHDPDRVAAELALDGLPIAGEVPVAGYSQAENWIDRAGHSVVSTGRMIARHLTRLSEWALWCWVYMIALRLVADPMWRGVLFESPLAALGRVLTGLP